MKQYQIQFAFNESTGKAGAYIGKVAVKEQALKIASAYAKMNDRKVDVFEHDTELNRVTNRWVAFASGGIWNN